MKIEERTRRASSPRSERNQVIDIWTHAASRSRRKAKEMMLTSSKADVRNGMTATSTRSTCMADSGARGSIDQIRQLGRHARSDGQAVGRDHRDAHQGQLPRGPEGAGVLLLDARRPQGSGRHRAQDGGLRLPDAQALRRRPERGHHDARLRARPTASPRASSTRARRSIVSLA